MGNHRTPLLRQITEKRSQKTVWVYAFALSGLVYLSAMAATPLQAQPTTNPTGTPAKAGLMPGRPMAPEVSAEITKARDLLARRQWQDANDLITATLAARPRDPQWRFLQGVLFAETGRRIEARSTFELLTEDFPELSEPYNNLAALYVEEGDLQKARVLLERAIQNRPDYALAHENLADIYARLAIESYERAAKANQPAPSVDAKLKHLRQTPALRDARITTNR